MSFCYLDQYRSFLIGQFGPGQKASSACSGALLLIKATGIMSDKSTKTQLNTVTKTFLHSLKVGILSIALLLIGVTLNVRSVHAQSLRGETELTPAPASLRAAVYPMGNSSMLWVRYENKQAGPVRIQIRDQRGNVIYDELKPQSLYAGEFDLTAWPAGTCTIELQTSVARYAQTIRIQLRSPVVATIISMTPIPSP